MTKEFTVSTEKFSSTPFIGANSGEFSQKSFLLATLHSIRLQLHELLGLTVEFSFSDYIKHQWKLNKEIRYPRSYVALNSFEVLRDRINNRAMRVGGITAKTPELNNATGNYLKQAKVFPIRLVFDLHYFDSDINNALTFVENLSVLSAIGGFSFEVTVQEKFEFQTRLVFDENISIPKLEFSNDSDPNSMEVTVSFTVDTYVGRVEDIARAFVLTDSETLQKPKLSTDYQN